MDKPPETLPNGNLCCAMTGWDIAIFICLVAFTWYIYFFTFFGWAAQHWGPKFPNWDQICAPCSGNSVSKPLDHQSKSPVKFIWECEGDITFYPDYLIGTKGRQNESSDTTVKAYRFFNKMKISSLNECLLELRKCMFNYEERKNLRIIPEWLKPYHWRYRKNIIRDLIFKISAWIEIPFNV